MLNRALWVVALCLLWSGPGRAETRWVRVGLGDCAGKDRAGSRGSAPDPRKCTRRSVGTAAVCWDGRAHRHRGFGHAACTYKTVAPKACKGGNNPGVMYRCVRRAPQPATGSAAWIRVGVGDCAGKDRAGSRGSAPDSRKCTRRSVGTAAVCWDGRAHRHGRFGHAACTYKTVAPKACKGGKNPGVMYRCVRRVRSPRWKRVGIGDCAGKDRAGSRGSAPDPRKCTRRSVGTAAVCWDGRAHRHGRFGHAACTYKTVAPKACKGGKNPGVMYRCVR